MSAMNPIVRMVISLSGAILIYILYWVLICHHHNVRLTWWSRTIAEYRLREGGIGFLRLIVGWSIAFAVYAFAVEDSGAAFTWHWLQECLLGGDWIGVLVGSCILAFAEWYRARKHLVGF